MEKAYRLIYSIITILCAVLFAAHSALCEELALISDAETSAYLSKVVKPLFKAAGLPFDENKILIVNDNSLNAFVSEGNYMFVNTGTILEVDNTNELAGVLAHETGHILGGHIVRQKLKLEKLRYAMMGSMLAAGAAAIGSGRGDAAMAVILGSQTSALHSMMHHQIEEERSADESAVKLLSATKQSTDGLKRFMQKIKRRNALSGIEENEYFRTHPMTTERISHFSEEAKNNKFSTQSPLDGELKMVKAKIAAFLNDKNKTWRLYPKSAVSADAEYAHAILYFREGIIAKALQITDELIKKQPKNPFFYELKGQFLFESGKTRESVMAYRQALKLLPNSEEIKLSLAQSVLESEPNKKEVKEIINLLNGEQLKNPTLFGWQLLARAYSMEDNQAYSYYAAAEYNYGIGNIQAAEQQLKYAQKSNPNQQLLLKIKDLHKRISEEKQ